MSVISATPLEIVPVGVEGTAVQCGSGAWVDGLWIEVFASTAAETALAGVTVYKEAGGTYSNEQDEIEFGIGAAGSEITIGAVRFYGGNSGGTGSGTFLFLRSIGGIAAGTRVAMRMRGTSTKILRISVHYYEDFDSDQAADIANLTAVVFPPAANMLTLTPNATAWVDSAIVELDAALVDDTLVAGIVFRAVVADTDAEIDLMTGAAGVEVVLTTIRLAVDAANTALLHTVSLPGAYVVGEGERLSVRLRKSGTSTAAWTVAVNGYQGTVFGEEVKASQVVMEVAYAPESDARVTQLLIEIIRLDLGHHIIGPLAWIHWPRRIP